MKSKYIKKTAGFMLIELLIVMFIIAVIATIAYIDTRRVYNKGKVTACISNLRNISTALNQYVIEHEVYPDSLSDLTPRYIKIIPSCPSTESDTYTAGYLKAEDPVRFTVYCSGHNHKDIGLDPNEPYYDFESGLGPVKVTQ